MINSKLNEIHTLFLQKIGMTSEEYAMLCAPYIAEANELSEIVKSYNPGRAKLENDLDKRTVAVKKSIGGKAIHRGYYCPSLIQDIVIGNVKRGRICKSDTSSADYLYCFDDNNKHIATKIAHAEGDDIEFIIYDSNKAISVYYSGKRLENVSLCEYDDNGRILKYIYASSNMFEVKKEEYEYSDNKLVVNYSNLLNCDPTILSLNKYVFNVENGFLRDYTVEMLDTEDVSKEDLDGRFFEVKIKRKI